MNILTPYQKFKDATWEYLKSRSYKKRGNDCVYLGKEFKTIVNIQRGKFKQDNYGFYNITYCRLDNERASIRYSDFFHMRHDFFDEKGFVSFGSSGYGPYPIDIKFETDAQILKAIKMLRIIEPIFRVETSGELLKLYVTPYERTNWIEWIDKLTKIKQ
jgi:hypothetical protein